MLAQLQVKSIEKILKKIEHCSGRFQKVVIDQPSKEDTKLIVKGLKKYYEEFHENTYDDAALDYAVDLAERYMHGKYNPDRAIDIIDVAGARQRLNNISGIIGKSEIEHAVSKITRIPLDMIDAKENTNYANLEHNIKQKLFGQNKAVGTLVESILVAKSGMRPHQQTYWQFLICWTNRNRKRQNYVVNLQAT